MRLFVHYSGTTKIGLVSKSMSLATMRNSYFCSFFGFNKAKINIYIETMAERKKIHATTDMGEHPLSENNAFNLFDWI